MCVVGYPEEKAYDCRVMRSIRVLDAFTDSQNRTKPNRELTKTKNCGLVRFRVIWNWIMQFGSVSVSVSKTEVQSNRTTLNLNIYIYIVFINLLMRCLGWGDELRHELNSLFGKPTLYLTYILYHVHQQCTQPLSPMTTSSDDQLQWPPLTANFGDHFWRPTPVASFDNHRVQPTLATSAHKFFVLLALMT